MGVKMELRTLKTFIKITQEHSFSKAAEVLGYSQSTVTMQIQQLEEELNTKLFERIGRKIELTDKGKTFLTYSEQIVRLSSEAFDIMIDSTVPSGTIRIGVVESLCTTLLPNILKEFHLKYPEVEIIIKLGVASELTNLIKNNTVDFALILDYPIQNIDTITYLSFDSPLVFLASPDNPQTKKVSLTIQDLAKETFILTEKDCSYRTVLDNRFHELGIHPRLFLELGNTEIIKNFVSNNLAITLLPQIAAESEIRNQTLMILDVIDYNYKMETQLLFHKNKNLTVSMKLFLGILSNSLQT